MIPFDLLLNTIIPALVLFLAVLYSVHFSFTRSRYLVSIISLIFLVGTLHQLAEVRTWLRTGRVPSPDWVLGDLSETLVYLLSVAAFGLFVYYYDRNQRLLAEKDSLLEEVHHRVKNNLQMMESLISYRRSISNSDEAKAHLNKIQDRLKSFSILYNQLYEAGGVQSVNTKDYFNQLCSVFEETLADTDQTDIRTRITPIDLAVEKAVACGLIINELITNSIQHADPAGDQLEVQVRFSRNSRTTLTVEDNAQNFDTDHLAESTGGLSLVKQIAEFDLNGEFKLSDESGMRAKIVFSAGNGQK
ncbi:MAG: sensor histidine kinase [bacterium]